MVKIEEYNVLSGRTMTKPPMSRSSYDTIFRFQITDGLALDSPHNTNFFINWYSFTKKENTINIHNKNVRIR